MGRTLDELLGMGKVAGRRGCCSLWGVHRLYFTPTDEHLDHFQIPVTRCWLLVTQGGLSQTREWQGAMDSNQKASFQMGTLQTLLGLF